MKNPVELTNVIAWVSSFLKHVCWRKSLRLIPIALALASLAVLNTAALTANRSPGEKLTFSERVAYQRAIEEVYWRHRIWPKERPDPKPSVDTVMSRATIEKKVQDYLRNSELLEEERQK